MITFDNKEYEFLNRIMREQEILEIEQSELTTKIKAKIENKDIDSDVIAFLIGFLDISNFDEEDKAVILSIKNKIEGGLKCKN